MKTCPNCHYVNQADSRFCIKCGLPISKPCQFCNSPNDIDAKFCTKCGSAIKDYDLFPEAFDCWILSYEYEQNLYISDGALSLVRGNAGKEITFEFEPENTYDPNAVAVFLNCNKIGYIHRGTVQGMVHDYKKRGWTVLGYINKYSFVKNEITFKIGFYKSLSIYESKQFRLVRTRKKIDDYSTRAENLSCCSEGEEVTVEYDVFNDSYTVYNCLSDEIGELPQSANDFMNENEYEKTVCILSELSEGSNGITNAKVTIYVIK